jgi:hypothetical protein
MDHTLYRYVFAEGIPVEEVEASVLLATLAAISLHGEADVRLDGAHYLDPDQRACVIDASTPVGRDVNRLFVGFLSREFGEDSFRVERVEDDVSMKPEEVAT